MRDDEMPAGTGTITPDQQRALDGLTHMRAIIDGTMPNEPICVTLGYEFVEAEHGRVVVAGIPGVRHLNSVGVIQGGYAATLLDSCAACAVHTVVAAGQSSTTIEFKINYIRPLLPDTGEVRATGTVISAGRRVATAEARLTDAAGKLYAHATATCLIFDI